MAHVVAVAAESVGSSEHCSTSSITESDGICTHAESTRASQSRKSRRFQWFLRSTVVERRNGAIVGHLEADGVRNLYSRILDVFDNETGQLLEIRSHDPDPFERRGSEARPRELPPKSSAGAEAFSRSSTDSISASTTW